METDDLLLREKLSANNRRYCRLQKVKCRVVWKGVCPFKGPNKAEILANVFKFHYRKHAFCDLSKIICPLKSERKCVGHTILLREQPCSSITAT